MFNGRREALNGAFEVRPGGTGGSRRGTMLVPGARTQVPASEPVEYGLAGAAYLFRGETANGEVEETAGVRRVYAQAAQAEAVYAPTYPQQAGSTRRRRNGRQGSKARQ